ncbi:hypothetical protein DFH08DRAFT_1026572 [Mycena albidolilacea]|uniref:Uncharacterized protein n=1 Tax=Mycena albidolilacea TaxID=1033008 RepID=A0AAD7EJG0_9AGAR|nr:hypothetical protein DFH08DRAFT_1026572 [Mycena albidolilacea]
MINTFLDWAQVQQDVWIVSNEQLLAWVQNPVPILQLDSIFNGIPTNENGLLSHCAFSDFLFFTCYGCPETKPAVGNPNPAQQVPDGQQCRLHIFPSLPFNSPVLRLELALLPLPMRSKHAREDPCEVLPRGLKQRARSKKVSRSTFPTPARAPQRQRVVLPQLPGLPHPRPHHPPPTAASATLFPPPRPRASPPRTPAPPRVPASVRRAHIPARSSATPAPAPRAASPLTSSAGTRKARCWR